MVFKRTVKRKLARARSMPGFLLASAGAVVWAIGTRSNHTLEVGIEIGLNKADKFLERYPAVQEQFREAMKRQ